jgi:hypothetical protein
MAKMEEKITVELCDKDRKLLQKAISELETLNEYCNKKISEEMMIPLEYLKEKFEYSREEVISSLLTPCRTVMFTGGETSSLEPCFLTMHSSDIAKFDEKKDIDI